MFALPARLGITIPSKRANKEYQPFPNDYLCSSWPHLIPRWGIWIQHYCQPTGIQGQGEDTHFEGKLKGHRDLMMLLSDIQKRSVSLAKGERIINMADSTSTNRTQLHSALGRIPWCPYGWTPERLPSKCACGAGFSVEHALSCPKGGFPSIRHNEIHDLTATLLTEVCNDVRMH